MLQSFFFVPANRPAFIQKANSLNADFIIFDFEESVPANEKENTYNCFDSSIIKDDSFARPHFTRNETKGLDLSPIGRLISKGFKNFILPKIESRSDIEQIAIQFSTDNDYSFVLLVENPLCFINIRDILVQCPININWIALGSHDFATEMGMKHTLENLSYARQHLNTVAKAFSIKFIDVVSMDLKAETAFKLECEDAVSKGYDGKFILHPNQLKALNSIETYTEEDIFALQTLVSQLNDLKSGKCATVRIDDKLYEKPHLEQIEQTLKRLQNNGNK